MRRPVQTENILLYGNLITKSERNPSRDENQNVILLAPLTDEKLQSALAEPFSATLMIAALTVGA
jgi:hypothetical protein